MKPRVLVFELHHLGDAVLAVPFLQAAMRHSDVGVVCSASVSDLLGTLLPGLRIFPAKSSWLARLVQMLALRRTFRPTTTVCAWADARVAVLAWAAGGDRRFGLPMTEVNYYASGIPWRRRNLRIGQWIEWGFRMCGVTLVNEPSDRRDVLGSQLSVWTMLAARLGWEVDLTTPWFEVGQVSLGPEGDDFFAAHRRAGRRVCVVHPGGRLPTKQWPVAAYQTLLETFFAQNDLAVLIIKPPGEPAPVPVGPLQLQWECPSHAALKSCLALADVVLCNDSYPAHLASAIGKPVVAVFGSGEPAWFAPYGNEQNVVRSSACPFHPCIDRCRMPSIVCLESIPPAMVAETLARVLKPSQRLASGA